LAVAGVVAAATAMAACATSGEPSAPSSGPVDDGADDGRADFVFRNGPIYTVAGANPWVKALAVTGKTITHAGDEAGAMRLVGDGTRVVDLGGRLLMPGFVEAHIHPFMGAFLTSGLDLQLPTGADALAAIAKYAKENPEGPVRGFGWRVDMFGPEGPSRADLDEILPDRPGFFFAIDGHSLWVNGKALQMAGVDRNTPDPIPGFSYYARDRNGDPTGYVLEVVAELQVVNAVEPISTETMAKLLASWTPKAAAAGITSVFDAGVPPIGEDQAAILSLYTDAEMRGELPFRVVASYAIKGPPVDDVVAKMTEVHGRIGTELVRANVLKIVGDGTQGGYTAWLLEPYADDPNSTGGSPFTVEQWHRIVRDADAAGFDVHVHACGERTVRVALDAIADAIAANPARDRRHAVAHLVYVEGDDNERFGKLGVIAQFSANWLSADPDTLINMGARYGAPRKDLLYRPRDVLASGGRISLGTDWPAAGYFSTYKPLDSIQIGVTRQLIGEPDAPVLAPADQRLTVAEAVHANTLGAAYQIRLDDEVGSLEVGKLADLIVLDRNILEIDPHDIHRATVTMTMMNGQIRHEI
jgi:predicted amidohydrolase YtcJ